MKIQFSACLTVFTVVYCHWFILCPVPFSTVGDEISTFPRGLTANEKVYTVNLFIIQCIFYYHYMLCRGDEM